MIKRIIVVLLIGIVLGVVAKAQKPEHVLDLTGVPGIDGMLTPTETGQVPADQRLGPGSIPLSPHGPMLESPFTFRVTLLDFDTTNYASRDPFFYEVRLLNIGDRPVSFPWSVDQSLFSRTVRESLVVYLGLGDINEARPSGDTGLIVLYGSPDVPGSVETVLPGESVRIRIRSQWMVFSEGTKRMRVFVLPSASGIGYPTITSENTVPILALGKRR